MDGSGVYPNVVSRFPSYRTGSLLEAPLKQNDHTRKAMFVITDAITNGTRFRTEML